MTAGETVTIDRRYRGPLRSANGGYACGLLGSRVGAGAEVTLRLPPPLERPLTIRRDGERLVLEDGDLLVAEAVAGDPGLEPAVAAGPGFGGSRRARASARSARRSSPSASSAARARTGAGSGSIPARARP